jgi:hypothetical protein
VFLRRELLTQTLPRAPTRRPIRWGRVFGLLRNLLVKKPKL